MRAPSDTRRRHLPLSSRRLRLWLVAAAVVLVVLLAFAHRIASFYTNFLWFRSVGMSSVWAKTTSVEAGLAGAFSAFFFALLWGNLTLADRLAPGALSVEPPDDLVARWQDIALPHMKWARLGISVIFALVGGTSAANQWQNWLLFSNAKPFQGHTAPWDGSDPLNHLNDGFYVFALPFLRWLIGWLFSAVVVTILLVAVAHYLNGGIRPRSSIQRVGHRVKAHLSVLFAALALLAGANYYFEELSLVLSKGPLIDGATYSDVHAVHPALVLLIAISAVSAALFIYNARQQGWVLPAVAVCLWGLVWVVVLHIYPAVVQAFVVAPSQDVKESQYIADNITATSFAYNLDDVEQVDLQGNAEVTAADVTGNSPTSVANRQSIANIPLISPNLPGTSSLFAKEQGFWGYFSMSPPEADRYELPTGQAGRPQLTEVLVSAREVDPDGVKPNWVSRHLLYTHGFGAAVLPANESGIGQGGQFQFSLSQLPPVGVPALNQPRVYFDDSKSSASGYVIAGSDEPEIDYEDVNRNEQTHHYNGSGGVPAGGFLRRLAFAVSFGDYNILLSDQVTSSSRVLYYRNVVQRLRKVAPFLSYDSHPYPVITGGRLYWVVDAYTTTDNFPYSEQAKGTDRLPAQSGLAGKPFNYVRDSVKCVVDAYNGTMWFFVQDPNDPVLQSYESAFPQLFTPMGKAGSIIPGITSHWRYPEDMFTVQTSMWATYHQKSASVFFQGSQAWSIAGDPSAGVLTSPRFASRKAPPYMAPTYELVALPQQTSQSFVLLQPFVPASHGGDKQTLTAFMTASGDPSDYGTLVSYTVSPGQEPIDGPRLVTTAVLEDAPISQELSLLGRYGSRVVLGEPVLTPIGGSLLYTVPVYLEEMSDQVPELADVVVVYNGEVYHSGEADPSLARALCHVANPDGSHPFASYCPSGGQGKGRSR
jgi:uncharacterized membrane protein (UPF0182 family)